MSKVYEALQKAERDRLARKEMPSSQGATAEPSEQVHAPIADQPAAPVVARPAAPAPVETRPLPPESRPNAPEPRAAAPEFRPPPAKAPAAPVRPRPAQAAPVATLDYDHADGGGRRGSLRSWLAPGFSESAPRLIMGDSSMSRAGEQFQLLRARFEAWVALENKRTMLVSSALRGEGKSFIALNFAATLAHSGHHILLIDADLRQPSLHRAFNLAPMHGLCSYLERRSDFNSCLIPTSVTGLTLVAAGGTSYSAPEAVGSSKMEEFLKLAHQIEPKPFILIDSPAALVAPEAEILARFADSVLMVVAANNTPRAAVDKALRLVSQQPLFGVVMNRFEPPYSVARHSAYRRISLAGLSDDD